MDILKGKKKNMFVKTWEKCRSMSSSMISRQKTYQPNKLANTLAKSKSWAHFSSSSSGNKEEEKVAPQGCFSVYVGPEKQRFVMKAKHANHPLFQMLLEDSENEYGYTSQGPILLPCQVDLFYKVLAEIDNQTAHRHLIINPHDGYNNSATAAASCSPFIMITPSRSRIRHHHGDNIMGGSYGLFSSPMLQLNN